MWGTSHLGSLSFLSLGPQGSSQGAMVELCLDRCRFRREKELGFIFGLWFTIINVISIFKPDFN